jgi:hypothetical protein
MHPRAARLEPRDLILQVEFSSLQFRKLYVICRGMCESILDLTFQSLVFPHKLCQMIVKLHRRYLLFE